MDIANMLVHRVQIKTGILINHLTLATIEIFLTTFDTNITKPMLNQIF